MAFPIVPVALGAGVLALILFSKPKPQEPGLSTAPIPRPPDVPPTPPPPEPVPPNPTPVPVGGAGAMVTATTLNIRSSPNENSAVVATVLRGTTVAIPDPTELHPPTPAAPVGWWNVVTPAGARGYASAQYLDFGTARERRMTPEEEREYHDRRAQHDRPVYTATPPSPNNPGQIGGYMYSMIGRHSGGGGGGNRGGHGGGGHRGGGHRGGHFHGGFNRGVSVIDVPFFGWPGYGYGYPYGYPGYGYPYGYPPIAPVLPTYNPWLAGYETYAQVPGYRNPRARDAYAAWQQAARSGADRSVVEHLKGQFESIIYATNGVY